MMTTPFFLHTGVRLERNEPESDKFRVDGLEPVPGALKKSVKTLLQLYDEWNSILVHLLVDDMALMVAAPPVRRAAS